jgi:hypothetical protein
MRIVPTKLAIGFGVWRTKEKVIRSGEGENGVVSESGAVGKDGAELGFETVPLIGRACDVAYDSPNMVVNRR